MANSKNEYIPFNKNGIGIQNVKKRLAFIYPAIHELKLNDEGNFFVVSLLLELKDKRINTSVVSPVLIPVTENILS